VLLGAKPASDSHSRQGTPVKKLSMAQKSHFLIILTRFTPVPKWGITSPCRKF
jgi:hypothetical protein